VNLREKTFGEALRDLRRSKNVSQRDLADKVGVDFSYISKVENGRLPPPAADTIEKICAVLEVSSGELLSLSGKVPTQVKEMLGTSSAAMEFAKQAQSMELTDDEWKRMTQRLKRLRKD
jgi:HTH-type transcriptional regulator, competence development regulator